MRQIFISYSSKEIDEATELCTYLENNGFKCWIAPRNVKAGGNYATQIVEAIRSCDAFVLVASENTNSSGHVSNEVSLAFDEKKTIIPFKIENIKFSDEYLYFLGRKHWIEAYENMEAGLKQLCRTLCNILDITEQPTINTKYEPKKMNFHDDKNNKISSTSDYGRKEIVDLMIKKSLKYPYNIYEKITKEKTYDEFKEIAIEMFNETSELFFHNRKVEDVKDIIDLFIKELNDEKLTSISVQGMPGSAKNMILQLVFYKMLDDFANGRSDCLPFYISSSYYEKLPYENGNVVDQMRQVLSEELNEYIQYILKEDNARPVILVEAIRKHNVSKISPENVMYEVLKPLGQYNRLTAVDIGLVKNKSKLKKVIPMVGDSKGYVLYMHSIYMDNKQSVLKLISCVKKLYNYDIDVMELYQVLKKLKYPEIDIFLVRLVIKEVYSTYESSEISITSMYEKLALTELNGDEDALLQVSRELFHYVFDKDFDSNSVEYNGKQWSLPHKHHTYLEFLIAYYFVYNIRECKSLEDYSFFRTVLTSMANIFVVSYMRDDYSLQETMWNFINEQYEAFDIQQKSNAAYWLGRISFSNLANYAISFLTSQFTKLKPIVKTNNKLSQDNLDRHFLFRSVCAGMLFQGQANMMDEYLCIVVTNDIANALNRGATIEYFGDNYQMVAHDEYYLDTDLTVGERALKVLSSRIEAALYDRNGKFVENNLVTYLTLVQARIQNTMVHLKFNIIPYVKSAIEYIKVYQTRPQNIASGKLLFYFKSILEDFEKYLSVDNFDVGPMVYNKFKQLRLVKRLHWVKHDIEDPESIAEHTYSTWLMAMFFLPEEINMEGYNKREILDMLLVHDMAEAEMGDQVTEFAEPKKVLKDENEVLRKLFLKGTYPDIANLTYYYNVWTGYYNDININAKTARDINLIQSVYTFCEYFCAYPDKFSENEVYEWLSEKSNLMTEIGFTLFDRLITNNSDFKEIVKKYGRM